MGCDRGSQNEVGAAAGWFLTTSIELRLCEAALCMVAVRDDNPPTTGSNGDSSGLASASGTGIGPIDERNH